MFGDERVSAKEISLFLLWLQCQGSAVSETTKLETHVRICSRVSRKNQYNALWAMNERAQERCRRVSCTCHVGQKLTPEIPQSSTLNHPIQAKTPKKKWSVQVRTCTDAPIALSKPHIILVSAHVTNLSAIGSAVPEI